MSKEEQRSMLIMIDGLCFVLSGAQACATGIF